MTYSGRIGAQVRKALILAAKTASVAAVIDASGCYQSEECSVPCPLETCRVPDGGGHEGGVDAGADARD